jgi:hypothetical protein
MRRVDLSKAIMDGWRRLDAAQRDRFFAAFVSAALRLDQRELRAWLLRRLKNPPLAPPSDAASLLFGDGDIDIALILKGGRSCRRAGQGRGRWQPAGKRLCLS